MTVDYQKLVNDFVEYEKKKGIRSLRKIPYVLAPFLAWIECEGLSFTELNYRKANEYQTYLSTLKNDDGTIHYSFSTVYDMVNNASRFYDYLLDIGKVYTNPILGIKRVKQEKRLPQNIPTEDKMDEFLATLRKFMDEKFLYERRNMYKLHVIAELLYASGLRLDEAARLLPSDIDFEKNIIHVRNGKGGKDRIAYLNDYASKVLKLYVYNMRESVNWATGETLFGVQNGRALDKSLNGRLKRHAEKCGIGRFTSHNFRHAIGFHLLRRGCDMRYIQIILGHDDLNTTTIYTRVAKEDLKNVLDSCHPRRFGRDLQ